jgi:polyadenylate-binding protein
LFEKFNTVGPVASIRVCRDAVTRRSLGYAYVNFQSPADAERALDTLNFESINGKPCRIMWCQRDPTIRRSGVGNVFVKGLDKTIDNKALFDAFSIFGNILSVKVVNDNTGSSVGRGFVHFETAQAAEDAIAKANGTLLKDKKITVAPFKSRKERMEEYGRTEHQFKNVFIKNLPEDYDEAALEKLFLPFGEITSTYLARDGDDSRKSKGFAFVCFADFDAAKKAVDDLNDKDILGNGRTVYVGRAMKKSERANLLRREYENRKKDQQQRSRGVNLYVKNLDDDFDDNKLRQTFEEFGTITSAKVMRDDKSNTRGFGFVCFSTQEEATRAITEFNGRIIGRKPLYVALAQPKEERRQHLNQQYRQRMQFQRPGGYMAQPNMYPQQMLYLGGVPPQFQQRPPFYPGNQRFNPSRFAPQAQFVQQQFPRQQMPYGGPCPPRPAMVPRAQPQGIRPPLNRPNTRYMAQARNVGAAAGMPQQAPQAATSAQQLASMLAQAEPERQKQLLGDHLYPIVMASYPHTAGKLTGMLLQMDNSELLHLLEDHEALQSELQKADAVLAQHATQ